MAHDAPEPRPVRVTSRDRMSRTVLVGLTGIAGLTVLGLGALVTGHADGATLGTLVAGISGCVGAVAGRGGAPGAST